MILKGLKRNAIKKNIESHIEKRNSSSPSISSLNTLAILIDATEPVNIVALVKLANELGVKSENLKVIGYKEDKDIIDEKGASYYNDKSFGMNGLIKNQMLQDFIRKDFDVLISFYTEDKIELQYVAAASKAKLKVGFAEVDHRINDLIIGSTMNNANLFIVELKKYLKILQVI